MTEKDKENGFRRIIKGGLGYISQILSGIISPQIEEGAEIVMKKIDGRLILLEKRILKKLFSILIIGFGLIFLIFALFFYLKEFLDWSNSLSFFSVGITIFVIGLILKIKEPDM